jgi:hypothetical protein
VLTAMATLSLFLLLAKHGMKIWRKRRLMGAIVEAHAALGECMSAALEDDGPLPGADAEYRRAREAQAALET